MLSETFVHHYKCPVKSVEPEFYQTEETGDSHWHQCTPGLAEDPPMSRDIYPCRWDLEGGARKLHFEVIEGINAKLLGSMFEIVKHNKPQIPLSHRRINRATWNYSVSYRRPGIYLMLQERLKKYRAKNKRFIIGNYA